MALQPIPLAAGSHQLASIPAAQHRLMNLYPEALPDGARSKYYLKSTPGLIQAGTLGAGPVYSTATLGGSLFGISGSHAYQITDAVGTLPAAIDLGSVGTVASSFYHTSIAIGLVGPCFIVPPNAYMSNFGGGAVTQITTGAGNWPASGVSSGCYLDGYYIFTSFTGDSFFTSDLLSPTVYSGLSFVKLSAEVDFVEHCTAFNRQLWLWGQNTISVWYNTGDALTPFSPVTGGVIHKGCGSYRSICELDGSQFFLGIDGVVYRTSGYQAKRISTHAIEELIALYDGGYLRTISACAFTHEGHGFYALSLSAINRTFVYDTSTDMWAERSSTTAGTGRWTINTASELSARWLLGDSVDGKLWYVRSSAVTEKGVAVKRLAQLPALVTHGPRAFMSRAELEMEVGRGGLQQTVLISWSDDGGATYTTPRALDAGTSSDWRKRVATTRLGSFRQRIFRLTCDGQFTLYSVDVDMGAGDS
jgi:hypothetical protein